MIGTASRTWLITSGGVRIAAATKATTIAYFRFDFSPSELTIPTLARRTRSTGSSKATPKAKMRRITSDRYWSTFGSRVIARLPPAPDVSKLAKNSQASGMTM